MAFSRLMLTTSGRILAAKHQLGQQLHFTRVVLGDGILGNDSMVNRKKVISEKLSMKIDARLLTEESTVSAFVATLSNEKLVEGFIARELALMAEDPDTHEELAYLYSYAGEQNAEYIPDKDSGVKIIDRIKLLVTLQNTENVTFVSSGNPLYITPDDLQQALATVGNSITAEIQIPVSAWQAIEGGYQAAVSIEGVTSDYYPIVTIHKSSRAAAKGAGLDPAAETTDDGTLLFVAESVPGDVIHASVALVAPGSATTTPDGGINSGSYTLPTATAARLGGVKIGEGVGVTPDGTISVDTDSVLDDILAPPGAMEAMLNEVFGPETEE